jgi:GMP synthase (glutamine-hydrolysing)
MVELIYRLSSKRIFFEGVDLNSQVWMSHDSIKALPTNEQLASTHDVEFAAYKIEGENDLC